MFKGSLFVLEILMLCFFVQEINAQRILQSDEIPKDLSIKLVRGACHDGNCPVYELFINSAGMVYYNGMLHTKLTGKATDKISQKNLKSLFSEFEKIDFFSLRNTYAIKEDGCTIYESHHNWEWISLTINGKSKEIAHDFGCLGEAEKFTKALTELGKKIDEVTNSKHWVRKRK
jgi:hypothetical protein